MKYLIIVIFLLFEVIQVKAQPIISGINASCINHAESIIINGSNFGMKSSAAPFRSSYLHPNILMNFQEIGSFNPDYWSTPLNYYGNNFVSLQDSTTRTNLNSQRYYVQMEYKNEGTGSGVRVYNLPMTGVDYFAWWDYFEPGFNPANMHTGCASFKYIYLNAGGHPHSAIQIMQNGKFYGSASGGVGGQTSAQQDSNLILPFGGGFYGRPISWVVNYMLPIGEWYFAEIIYKINSASGVHDGWYEFRINNQLLWRANNIDIFDPGYTNDPDFEDIAFGGNYGWDGGNDIYYRYYGDFYIDGSFSRVIIGNYQNYNDCSHLELQIPTTWKQDSITIGINQGTFNIGDTAYLFVIDDENNISNGYQIVFSSTGVNEENKTRIYSNPCRVYMGINFITFKNLLTGDVIKIYNISGRLVHTSGDIINNIHIWNLNNVSSGIYFYKIVGEQNINGKVVIIR